MIMYLLFSKKGDKKLSSHYVNYLTFYIFDVIQFYFGNVKKRF